MVGEVRAVDADTGDNAAVTYFIQDPESPFRVEEDTGRLFTRQDEYFATKMILQF